MEPINDMQIGLRLRERRLGSGRPDSDHLGSGVCMLGLELGVVYSVAVVLVV